MRDLDRPPAVTGGVPGEEGSRPLVAVEGAGPGRLAVVDGQRGRLMMGDGGLVVAHLPSQDGEGALDRAQISDSPGDVQRAVRKEERIGDRGRRGALEAEPMGGGEAAVRGQPE